MKLNLAIQTHDDVAVLEDPFNPGETYTRPRVQLVDVDVVHLVAAFSRVKDAQAFAECYLTQGRSSEANVRFETSRVVRWDAVLAYDPPVSSKVIYVHDLAENVYAVGGSRATLNFADTHEPSVYVAPRDRR